MVNEELKREIKDEFLKGLEDALAAGAEPESWLIKEKSSNEEMNEKEFFMLTISSQLFRIFVLLHFTKNEATEQYTADILKAGSATIDDDKYYDFLGEVGNAFCGSLKRELAKTVPSLGMSTPNRLSQDCMKYIDALKIDYECHASAEHHGNPLFYASIYVCADEELNYEVKANAAEDEVDSGELEFF